MMKHQPIILLVLMILPFVKTDDIKIGFVQPTWAIGVRKWVVPWAIKVAQHQGILHGHNIT